MDNQQTTTLFLIPIEAQKFLVFQKHYDFFAKLIDAHVTEQKNASIILDFDKNGVLQSIRRNDFLYSSRH